MKTRQELINECKLNNPKIIQIINDQEIELNDEDYKKACSDWADMILVQLQAQAEAESKAATKQALLDKLGITAEEAALLLA
jgi:hypothetical protein